MRTMGREERWSRAAQWLHGLGIVMLAGVMTGGVFLHELGSRSPAYRWVGLLHSLGGVALGALTVARLIARWRQAPPAELPLPALRRRGIALVHGLLYAALFVIVLSGMAMARSSGWHAFLMGETAAPQLSGVFRELHEHAGHVLLMLLGLHVGGALLAELTQGRVLRRIFGFLK